MAAQHTPGPDVAAEKVICWLLTAQQGDLRADTGHGYRSARQVGQAISLPTDEARAMLHGLADAGRVRRFEVSNGLFWRTVNPLPWEPGGKWPGQAERELRDLKEKRAALLADLAAVDAAIAKATGGAS